MARFQEISLDVDKSYLSTGWYTFGTEFTTYQFTGIKFQTKANSPFYLSYRTYNKGRGWLPYVSSMDDDYAGFWLTDSRSVQSIGIQIMDSATGNKLDHKYIVMYRARVGNKFLPWVSNAAPALMQEIYDYFRMEGGLDMNAGSAGTTSTDDLLKQFEIRIFRDDNEGGSTGGGDFSGGEVGASMSYMVNRSWDTFERGVLSSPIDGLKIQTGADKDYYLLYKTWNEGKGDYYPPVKSAEDDYAGSSGKPIQRLNIQAYKKDGTKLTSGVIVMYRAYVDGRWLSWVSNANPEWMRDVQTKYSLDGTLDITGSYAGIGGKNVEGLEIRIFEDNSGDPGSGSLPGSEVGLATRYLANGNWSAFSGSVLASPIDGIEIRTSGKDYYLLYKTWNSGKGDYYPAVKSTEDDYAGSSGKPVQRLSIQVYKNDGTKLTSGVVVMYRAYVDGRWLPWVSNADPEWMRSAQLQYNLGGTLDTSGAYAGISSKDIAGIEIRAFEGNIASLPEEDLPGEESASALSYLANGSWKSFSHSVLTSPIDGIKIQTASGKPYYIAYRTWNEGRTYYYPEVTSRQDDYAGYPGRPIQLLQLHVYKNDGTKLTTGVVVMYRVYVDGRWLSWVSNADPSWMQSVQAKYHLDGTLDTSSAYAGIQGKNISGIEIRVFEENSPAVTPSGKFKIIENVPFISQNGVYPTGCECVTTTMALNYAGVDTTVDRLISKLSRSGFPFDPNLTFGGDPRSPSGYGCYAPVIMEALGKILSDQKCQSNVLYQVPLGTLCSQYIDKDIPVILWATMGMRPSRTKTWYFDGRTITWVQPEHCLLLVGYDDNSYIFHDPQSDYGLTYYNKASVEAAYRAQSSQAIVVIPEKPPYTYQQPPIPKVPDDAIPITTILNDLKLVESLALTYFTSYNGQNIPESSIPPAAISRKVANFLRSQEYADWEWIFTTTESIDWDFVSYVQEKNMNLYNRLYPYILHGDRKAVSDGQSGFIDLSHFAATLGAYLSPSPVPSFWASWGGDLATGMAATTKFISETPGMSLIPVQIFADDIIGGDSSCNYSDFCSDFDAYGIYRYIQNHESGNSKMLLTEGINWYYSNQFKSRFRLVFEEVDCPIDLDSLKNKIYTWMNGPLESNQIKGLLKDKGKNPPQKVNKACCNSFAQYIFKMI